MCNTTLTMNFKFSGAFIVTLVGFLLTCLFEGGCLVLSRYGVTEQHKCVLGEPGCICAFRSTAVSGRENTCRSAPCNFPVPCSPGAASSTRRGAGIGGYTWSDTTICPRRPPSPLRCFLIEHLCSWCSFI